MRHEEPKIRCATVEVIARICGPQAQSLIKPLADDGDETIRQAVKKALAQFPQP
ncbi:MAG: HEAT repeat domain-containing protein [Desulfobacteraceae bacterium]|nr:HEAT repeat domain-containing protein [Desulfobacteraceae bacterium]